MFKLGGQFWMIVDEWRGQAVYRSEDASGGWTRQEYLDGLILTADPKSHLSHIRAAVLEVQDGTLLYSHS
ncbi:hypothetical protein [Pseudarthrobacter cellobiosi]|uniref:hypothetical protein n=1 Tax=Pseudarthrobacter cellobiosi TaxID=2953654 RepID=UPI00208E1896|nr:hypothetical protein [Pseudarthrobacter sp. HLT1-5]MCO4256258.1 hypothetical protein [Pseudarthrobacter sp. HLT1-5]